MFSWFKRIFSPKVPREVSKMFAHQRLGPREHPVFGPITPCGIAGWRTTVTREVSLLGGQRRMELICQIGDPDSAVQQQNFQMLLSLFEAIARRFVELQLQELEGEAGPWSEVSMEVSVRDSPFDLGAQWVGEGTGGPNLDDWHLFFEGLELKGIVPKWNDPEAKGFGNWEW